jgi:hypothetical protein
MPSPRCRSALYTSWVAQTSLRAAALTLALVPLSRIVYIVLTFGTNNPSNDDVLMVRLLGNYWSGNYQWSNLLRHTFDNGHCVVLPSLVYVANSHLTRLDTYPLLMLGLLLAAAKLGLFHRAIVSSGPRRPYGPWLLLPVLSAMVFSVSLISVFEYDFASISNGLYKLGYAVVIWALVTLPKQSKAVWIACAGATVSALSSGLLPWAILLIGMTLLGFRRVKYYLMSLPLAGISILPYVLYLRARAFAPGNLSPFNFELLLNTIGRPFANNISKQTQSLPAAQWAGIAGILLCLTGLVIAWALWRRAVLPESGPALLFIAFGLLSCWQTSIVRTLIAPWYATNAMDFWIGLVALAYSIWSRQAGERNAVEPSNGTPIKSRLLALFGTRVWPPVTVGAVLLLLVFSNRTRSDKSFFMSTRSPVSVACLQHYRIAPTYCGCFVHTYPGIPNIVSDLAKPLEDNEMSVFRRNRISTLQGESILPTVSYTDMPGVPETRWSSGLKVEGIPVTDYRRLNLMMSPPNTVAWTVSLPRNLRTCRFNSDIALPASPLMLANGQSLRFSVFIVTPDSGELPLFTQSLAAGDADWHPVSIDLSSYAGQTLTLKLKITAAGSPTGVWGAFRHPYIELALDGPAERALSDAPIAPSNTELSPYCVRSTPDDFRFDVRALSRWDIRGLRPEPPATEEAVQAIITEPGATMTYVGELHLPMAEFSHLLVRMSAPADMVPRSFAVNYVVAGPDKMPRSLAAVVPLLKDGQMHTYSFDLRINGPLAGSYLTGFALSPSYGNSAVGSIIEVADVRLVRRNRTQIAGSD